MLRRHGCLLALLFPLAAGCGTTPTAPPKTYPVTGKVLLAGGEPLRGGRVTFSPQGAGAEAVGEIQSNGTFTLTTFGKDQGAMPGKYKVSVSPFSYKTGNPVAVPQRDKVPQQYWETDTTPLEATIKPEANELPPFTVR